MYTMLKGFQHFSKASGLEVKKNKNEFYTTRISSIETQRVLDMSGFN